MTSYTPPTIGSSAWGGPLNDIIAEIDTDMQNRPLDEDVVHATGDESITGVKSFASAPVVPDASFTIAKVAGLATALSEAAVSSAGVSEVNGEVGPITLIEGDGIEITADVGTGEITITSTGGDSGHVGAGTDSIALGVSATATQAQAIGIGRTAAATGAYSTVVGPAAIGSATYTTVLGSSADAEANYATALGADAYAAGVSSVSVGEGASSSSTRDVAIGYSATVDGGYSVAIGSQAYVEAAESTALGTFATVASGHTNSTALGANAETTAANQVMLGTATEVVHHPGKMSAALRTPASATATGVQGEFCFDANYIYVCTATNTWKRVAVATW